MQDCYKTPIYKTHNEVRHNKMRYISIQNSPLNFQNLRHTEQWALS